MFKHQHVIGLYAKKSYIISFKVKVGKVDGDAVLLRCHNLPNTVLVGGVKVRERWTLDRPIG